VASPLPLRRAAAGAVLALVLVAACGGDDADDAVPDDRGPAPLTGLPVDDPDVLDRPAVVVKVDNGPAALGVQDGIGDADVVFTELVEGGSTRLAAVFHSTGAASVGPVRSARTSDLAIVGNLHRPVFAFSGANGAVLQMVRDADVIDAGFDRVPDVYEERGTGVLRFFVDTADLLEVAPDDAEPPEPLFRYRDEGTEPDDGEATGGVEVAYGGAVDTMVRYEPTDTGWLRHQEGDVHADAEGRAVEPENVIVQLVTYVPSGFVDVTGAESPEAVLVGEGDALVLTGGQLVRGRWSRDDSTAPTRYTDADGDLIALEPGRTWIELAPVGSATVQEPVAP
jgi:hypothetical protein